MSTVPAGWHPDPNLPQGSLRWWDGSQWTEHVQPAPVAPPASTLSSIAQPHASVATGLEQLAARGAQTTAPARQRSLFEINSTTFVTFGVVALYILVAASTGIVLLGIFPVMLSIRAFRRGEPLAPLAMAAAALALLIALSAIARV